MNIRTQNKKGIPLAMAATAVLTLVSVAVLVIVAIYLFSSLGTSSLVDGSGSFSVINETATVVTTGTNLSYATLIGPACSISTVTNGTTSVVISSGNYTISNSGCTIANTTSAFSIGATSWRITYTVLYDAPNGAYNASQVTNTNFSGYPALVGLVGTIIFLGLVIGVLVGSFVGGKSTA